MTPDLTVEYHDDPPTGSGPCVICRRTTTGTVLNYDGIGSGWSHLCRANAGCQR